MKISISFLGDISFNDDYINLYKNGKKPFSATHNILKNQDYVIGNLECMAKGEKGENLAKKPRLTTTVETLGFLNQIPVNLVSLAQNHIYDHLDDGFIKTTEFLNNNNIRNLGASLNNSNYKKPLIINKNNVKIGILNYVTKDTNPNLPNNAKVNLNIFELNNVINDIKELKNAVNHVVLLLHWGGRVEGGLFPDWNQPNIAYKLIDAGADLIIGHHPHTIQPFEIYKEKYIFYSLGNFCFSDYVFEEKFNPMPFRRMITPIVNVEFKENYYTVDIKYFKNEKTHFVLINYANVMNRRNKIFSLIKNNRLFWNVYFIFKQNFLPIILFFARKDLSLSVKIRRIIKSFLKKVK